MNFSPWEAQSDPRAQRVNDALRPVVARTGIDAVNGITPLMEVVAAEGSACDDEDFEAGRWEGRIEGLREALFLIFEDGYHPGLSMRRLYALAARIAPETIACMSAADLGSMFGETRAAFDNRMNKMFEGTGVRGRDQKRMGSVEKMRESAGGNDNRANGEKKKRILGE
ncbi:MAG: hypothetical protein ACPG32_04510 [Akkermansiaceae bacterium]